MKEAANDFMRAAKELEEAAKHYKASSIHFANNEVPRGCAHAFAAEGHILKAKEIIDQRSKVHSEKANTDLLLEIASDKKATDNGH